MKPLTLRHVLLRFEIVIVEQTILNERRQYFVVITPAETVSEEPAILALCQ